MGLLDEAAPQEGPGKDKLREYGLGEEEIDFLIGQGRRVELNAMTSDQFVAWLEGKLAEHGAGKVVPETEVLERHARRVLARNLAADRVRSLIEEAEADAAGAVLPVGLGDRVLIKLEEERGPQGHLLRLRRCEAGDDKREHRQAGPRARAAILAAGAARPAPDR